MKELGLRETAQISGAGGEQLAQLGGTLVGTWASGGNPYAGALGGYVAGELYTGIQNGHQIAPGIGQGLGSYNPNYNPGLIGPWQPSGNSFSLAEIQAIGWARFQKDVWGG
ncbi:hypothetical protein QZQ97_10250 [Serratia sp. root2]|uniref:hypothetical protein n=1 Tax=Serratia sp. root2 TaxID=3059676 RepID=UPI00288F4AE9|nr:hypothetical protein [Serratia sp. root2]MDT3251315.1 hypothetical protein [Serratia sp. root2]